MKKYVVFSFLMIVGLVSSAGYAVHPGSANSTATSQVSSTATTSQATVPAEVKSPWSGSIKFDIARSIEQKPLAALSNETSLGIGRTLVDDVSLNLTMILDNSFTPDTEKQGVDRYVTTVDPLLTVSKGKLFEVAGISATGLVQAFLPVTEKSRRDGDERKPHKGLYRTAIGFSKDISRWSLSTFHRVAYYNYQNQFALEDGVVKETLRFGLLNEVAASYKLTDVVSVASALDIFKSETRDINKEQGPSSRIEWVPSLDLSPMKNLGVSLSATFKVPNQTFHKYWQDRASRIANTSGGLTISYKFL